MTEAGKLNIKWQAETAEFMQSMSKARKELKTSSQRMQDFGKSMRKAGAVMTAAGGAIVGSAGMMVKSWAEAGDEIHKAGLRTGFSADALSRWRVVAERSGTDLKAVETGVKRMQRSIVQLGDGLAESTRSFDRLGLSLEDIQNLAPEEQMRTIMERMADIEDPTIRAATAQEIFGRAGTQLLPVLEDGAEGLADLMKVADETGETFTEDGAKSAAEYQDALRDMKGAIQGLVRTLAVELAPVFQDVITRVKEFMVSAREWIGDNQELATTISKVALAIGGILVVLGPTLMALGQFLIIAPKLAVGIKAITLAFTGLNPILLGATLAIAGLTTAYLKYKSAVEGANRATDLAAEKQREVITTARDGVEAWKKYGSESVDALEKQGLSIEDAKEAARGMFMMEAELRQAGNKDAADKWRERANIYKEYYSNYQEDLTENHDLELEKEQDHNEALLEEYGLTVEQLNEMDDDRLTSLSESSEQMKSIIESLMETRDAEADNAEENSERIKASEKAKARAVGNAAGNIIDGNIAAATSSLIASYLSTLGAFGIAAAGAAPSLVRKLMPDVPRFAEGGIVSGPTMGMMGEYPGVKSNPEVIAPLDKLQGMMGGGANINVNVDVDRLAPESVNETLFRITEGLKRKIPEALDFAKESNSISTEVGGLS